MPLVFVVGLANCSKEDYIGRSEPQEAEPRSQIISQHLGNNPGNKPYHSKLGTVLK